MNIPLPAIENVVVLMFENRSFDNMLGRLYPELISSGTYDGLTLSETNTYTYHDPFKHTKTVPVTNQPPSGHSPYITPYPDPGESFDHMTEQIFGYNGGDTPNMSGFAQNYHDVHLIEANPGDIMFYFEPSQVPVTSFLASHYAVCDQWFASGPVQTYPNRMFCHCGTPSTHKNLLGKTEAHVNDLDYIIHPTHSKLKKFYGSVTDESIFQRLDGSGGPNPANWKVYFHDAPLSALCDYVYQAWTNGSACVSNYDGSDYDPPAGTSFADDVMNDALPTYAFIEPRYFNDYSGSGLPSNSNHPGPSEYLSLSGTPIDVRYGECLLSDVYQTLVSNLEVFNKTLLIVTYDENGGVYDHRPPNTTPFASTAISPFTEKVGTFTYDRYGVRVPTFFVNPAIPPNTIYRPSQPSSGPFYPFDHTSILSTLRARFDLGGPLTPRDGVAPVLDNLIPESPTFRGPDELAVDDELRAWIDAIPKAEGSPAPAKTVDEHEASLLQRLAMKAKGG